MCALERGGYERVVVPEDKIERYHQRSRTCQHGVLGIGRDQRETEWLLGNVVISKNFLRTRKIMVMHSKETGECCPRTLVDRKRKR